MLLLKLFQHVSADKHSHHRGHIYLRKYKIVQGKGKMYILE